MIDKLYSKLNSNLDNPEWLSKYIVFLSSQLFTHNTQMAHAETAEKKVIVDLLTPTESEVKKMSVAEAEKRAVVETQNKYGIMKAQAEAIIETINSIKTRIKVLEWERQVSNNVG